MTWTPTWIAPRSWAASGWSRPPTCPATTAGSRSSPTRTATRSGFGAEDSQMNRRPGTTGGRPAPLQATLGSYWAIVLRRFRDYVHHAGTRDRDGYRAGRGDPPAQ